MAGVAKQIIGSFEDIGKDIVREAAKVPADIVGKALESLGTSSQKGQKGNPLQPTQPSEKTVEKQKIDKATARAALENLAGPQKQKEPTVQERLEKEKREKQEKEAEKGKISAAMAPVSSGSSKAKRGNLYGIKQKSSTEMSKNTRQD